MGTSLKAGEGDDTGLSFHSFLEARASKSGNELVVGMSDRSSSWRKLISKRW